MKALISIYFFLVLTTVGISQNYWDYYNTNDGLINNSINKLIIENNQSIYLGTDIGLSHFNQGTFTNYTAANSGLNTNKILDMELGNNLLFLHTDSGVTVFDGFTFTNYTSKNGLPSNTVKEIQVTSNGTLWVGTTTGVTSFDGTQFTQYPNKVAHALGVDSADRIYIITKSFLYSNGTTNNLEIYDGATWNSFAIADPDTTALIYSASFRLLKNGHLILCNSSTPPFYSVSNNTLNAFSLTLSQNANSQKIDQIQADQYGKYWVGYPFEGYYNPSLYSGVLTDLKRHSFNQSINQINSIDVTNNSIAFATDNGFYIASIDVPIVEITSDFNVNTISTSVSSKGPIFHNYIDSKASFEFPMGKGTHGVYSSSFLVSAKKITNTSFEAHPIEPHLENYFPGPKNTSKEITRSFMAKVSKVEILNHIANSKNTSYQMPDGIMNWPAIGDSSLNEPFDLAPFMDVNSNGCYDPINGDYPIIKGDEAIFWINRPNDTSALSDLEYHNMLYGFNDPNDPLINQTVFLERTFVNRANVTYDSIKVGLWLDIDVGEPFDDYVGCDSINNIIYGYNGDADDAGLADFKGYGVNAPAVGAKFLSDSMDTFFHHGFSNSINGIFYTAGDIHNHLNAKWKNGQHMTYGGNGFNLNTSTIKTNYMFTGNPANYSGWTEWNERIPNGDRILLASIPYFSLMPAERKTITIAIGYGFDSTSSGLSCLNAIPAMINSLNHAKTVYDNMQIQTGTTASNFACPVIRIGVKEEGVSNSDISIYPVPSNGLITISSDEIMKSLQVVDVSGSIIMETDLTTKGLAPTIQFPNSIKNGFYFLRIQRQDNSWETKKVVLAK
jgi:hypothetical protein